MPTPFEELYEWDDETGLLRKRKRPLRRDETGHIPMTWQDGYEMDASGRLRARGVATTQVVDALGFVAGHKPGFCYANDVLAVASSEKANESYEEFRRRLSNAWRKNKGKVFGRPRPGDGFDDDEGDDDAAPARTLDAAQLRALADQAYADKCERMRNAWRNR
jgi:hypothetical protein